MGAKKNITAAGVMSSYIKAGLQGTGMRLTNRDQSNVDQVYVEGIQKEIETFILPLFNSFHSLDDVICLAEEEESLPREKRIFFPYNIYHDLTRFQTAQGWKEKALEMCDKYIETTPATSQYLAKENKKKYIQYFEKTKRI